MGIYDRDYVRQRQPPTPGGYGRGGLSAMKMWSANTWIIIICVAVFVIDSLMPMQAVPMDIRSNFEGFSKIDTDAYVYGDVQVTQTYNQQPLLGNRPILVQTPQGLQPVAVQEIMFMHPIAKWMHFSTQRGFLQVEFWRLIGFQFLHGNLMHLLFNMIGLFFFGPMVERYLGSKRYVAFYLLCGIFGALMYVLLNLSGMVASMLFGEGVNIPGLLFNSPNTPLVGASAGVFGVLMAGAFLAPNAMVLLFFFLPMRLKTLAYALVGVALFTIIFGGSNAGGEAGHLGGALAGFYFIRHPQHLHGFFDFIGWADPTSHHYRHKRRPRTKPGRPDKIDAILKKVSREGVQSLSAREKKILHDASEE